ncbi:MAG: hypothetical protein PHZ14_10730 [Sulfuricella sp.]|nr:hypothetical protein [Sulfuricella sp.]
MENNFTVRMNGEFHGILRWTQLDGSLEASEGRTGGLVRQPRWRGRPHAPLDADARKHFVEEMDASQRREHEHDYCGVVYADDPAPPSLIKIYDPHRGRRAAAQ